MTARKKTTRRRKSAPQPTNPISAAIEAFNWKWLVGFVVALGSVAVAIIALKNVHPIVEPVVPALRGYVREYSDDSTKQKLEPISKWMGDYEGFRIEQTMELAKINLTNLNQNLLTAKKELESNPGSQILRDTVASLEKQVRDTRSRIESYESALFAKRQGR